MKKEDISFNLLFNEKIKNWKPISIDIKANGFNPLIMYNELKFDD